MQESLLKISDDELENLLKEVIRVYKYDFTSYSRESLSRRVNRILALEKIPSVAELQYKVLNDATYFGYFVEELTVNVTEMFRDPSFYKALVHDVFPLLSKHEFIRIWHAGCSTGEEVYSLAILLKEYGLLDRSILYGTDLNPNVLEKAKSGIFHVSNMKTYTENYIRSGGKFNLSDYYTLRYGQAMFSEDLKKRMVFSVHNLVTDQSFNEFHLILCRNVLIYFNRNLQDRVFSLFTKSLPVAGLLALGSKETLQHSGSKNAFSVLNKEEKIWIKNPA